MLARAYVETFLLLTDVSELLQLGALAFLRYCGQLLNQLGGHTHTHTESYDSARLCHSKSLLFWLLSPFKPN